MGPRRKFHLVNFFVLPAGYCGLCCLGFAYGTWLIAPAVLWVLYWSRLSGKIQCPHCNHRLVLGKWELGPIRFRSPVSYVGPACLRCGRIIDAPRTA